MDPWDGWDLGRAVVAFSAVLYLGIWGQATLMHRAGAFKHPLMYAPVFSTPLVVAGAIVAVVARDGPWGIVAAILSPSERVFSTAGGAQPSQSIMALATRLADHLGRRPAGPA